MLVGEVGRVWVYLGRSLASVQASPISPLIAIFIFSIEGVVYIGMYLYGTIMVTRVEALEDCKAANMRARHIITRLL